MSDLRAEAERVIRLVGDGCFCEGCEEYDGTVTAVAAALAAAESRGAVQALREAAAQMDSSESDQWTREEARDWLLFHADVVSSAPQGE